MLNLLSFNCDGDASPAPNAYNIYVGSSFSQVSIFELWALAFSFRPHPHPLQRLSAKFDDLQI